MAQVINTNSLSLITQNNINKNQSALSTSIERLSLKWSTKTGHRVRVFPVSVFRFVWG